MCIFGFVFLLQTEFDKSPQRFALLLLGVGVSKCTCRSSRYKHFGKGCNGKKTIFDHNILLAFLPDAMAEISNYRVSDSYKASQSYTAPKVNLICEFWKLIQASYFCFNSVVEKCSSTSLRKASLSELRSLLKEL